MRQLLQAIDRRPRRAGRDSRTCGVSTCRGRLTSTSTRSSTPQRLGYGSLLPLLHALQPERRRSSRRRARDRRRGRPKTTARSLVTSAVAGAALGRRPGPAPRAPGTAPAARRLQRRTPGDAEDRGARARGRVHRSARTRSRCADTRRFVRRLVRLDLDQPIDEANKTRARKRTAVPSRTSARPARSTRSRCAR